MQQDTVSLSSKKILIVSTHESTVASETYEFTALYPMRQLTFEIVNTRKF